MVEPTNNGTSSSPVAAAAASAAAAGGGSGGDLEEELCKLLRRYGVSAVEQSLQKIIIVQQL